MNHRDPILLGSENLSVGGFLEWLRCERCDFNSYRLILQADTDMVYMGVMGLTDIASKRILITHLSSAEWHNFKEYVPSRLENRINTFMGIDSFRCFQFQAVKSNDSEDVGMKIICPKCNGSLQQDSYLSFSEYLDEGGEILTLHQSALKSYKKEQAIANDVAQAPMTYRRIFGIISNYKWSSPRSNACDMDRYLRALYNCMEHHKDEKIGSALVMKILTEAEHFEPIAFDESWEQQYAKAYDFIESREEGDFNYYCGINQVKNLILGGRQASKEAAEAIKKIGNKGVPIWMPSNGLINGAMDVIIDALTPYKEEHAERIIPEEVFDWGYIPQLLGMGMSYE